MSLVDEPGKRVEIEIGLAIKRLLDGKAGAQEGGCIHTQDERLISPYLWSFL
jgi:hypothetical protein